jgi:sugar/nucleoside kinase (ribokinase family)
MVPVEGFTGVARATNGAGDSFIAAFACAIGAGQSLRSAVRYACHAAALITQGPGLVEALHFWADLEPPVPQKS